MKYISKSATILTPEGVEVPYLANSDDFIIRTKKDRELRAKEYSDCVVVSIAHALDISYTKAHAFCKEFFSREDKQGVLGFHRIAYTNRERYKTIAEKYFGSKVLKRINTTSKYRNRCHWSGEMRSVARNMTLKTFLKTYPKGRFILAFNDHAIAVIDGIVCGNGTATDAFRLRRRVGIAVEVK